MGSYNAKEANEFRRQLCQQLNDYGQRKSSIRDLFTKFGMRDSKRGVRMVSKVYLILHAKVMPTMTRSADGSESDLDVNFVMFKVLCISDGFCS